MDTQYQAVVDLPGMSPLEKAAQQSRSAGCLTDHPAVFADPDPQPKELQKSADDLTKAYNAAQGGSDESKLLLEQQVGVADENLRTLRLYVNSIAKGSQLVIEQSGMRVSRTPTPTGDMLPPDGGRFVGHDIGQAKPRFDAQPGARSYAWIGFIGPVPPPLPTPNPLNEFVLKNGTYVREEEGPRWMDLRGTTAATRTDTGLPRGQFIHYCCAAIGPKGQGPWSAPVNRVIP